MKNFIYGLIVGFILAFVFIFYSGGEYIQKFGKKTERAGSKVVDYEADLKRKVDAAKKTAMEKAEEGAAVVKEKAKESGEAVKEKAREAVKESIKETVDEKL